MRIFQCLILCSIAVMESGCGRSWLSSTPSCDDEAVKSEIARIFVENSFNFKKESAGVLLGWSDAAHTQSIIVSEGDVIAAMSFEFSDERAIKKEPDIKKITCSSVVTTHFDPKKINVNYNRVWFNRITWGDGGNNDSWDQNVTRVISDPIQEYYIGIAEHPLSPWQIQYIAQYTDDGKLYVEIDGRPNRWQF